MTRLLMLTAFAWVAFSAPLSARERPRDTTPQSFLDFLFGAPRQAPPPERNPPRPAAKRHPPKEMPKSILIFGKESLVAAEMHAIATALRACADMPPPGARTFSCAVEYAGKRVHFEMTYACADNDDCLAVAIMQEWCRSRGGTWKIGEAAFSCEA